MRASRDSGQNVFQRPSAFAALGLAAVAALSSATWFFASPVTPIAAASAILPPHNLTAVGMRKAATPPSVSPPIFSEPAPSQSSAPIAAAKEAEPAPTLATLEQRFHVTRGKEDRIELAGEIASANDAAAVATLARIFPLERHPEIKISLIASLNDIDHSHAPEARLAMLTAALRGQPRNVRAAALDSLAQLDDPRILPLLKKSMQQDPYKEVRDLATALCRAVTEAR